MRRAHPLSTDRSTNLRRYNFQLSVRPRSAARSVPFTVRFLYPPPVFVPVEGAGHAAHLEQPEATAATVIAFLGV